MIDINQTSTICIRELIAFDLRMIFPIIRRLPPLLSNGMRRQSEGKRTKKA